MKGELAPAAAVLLALAAGACTDGADEHRSCVPAPAGAAGAGRAIGVAAILPRGDSPDAVLGRAEAFAAMAAAGLTELRQDFLWHEIEPVRGALDFAAYDALVDDAIARGVRLLGLLVYSAPWAASGPDVRSPPENPDDYAAFAGATAAHFAGRVDRWEVWNEPNVAFFWASEPEGDPAAYADLLVRASAAIRAASPGATVAFAGTIFHAQPFVGRGAAEFLEEAFEAVPDLAGSFDVVALHPYPRYPPQTAPEARGGGERPVDEMIAEVRAVMAAHGAGSRPLWITELGWPTWEAVTPADQARYLVRAVLLALAAGAAQVELYTLYDLAPGTGTAEPEERFGLYEHDPVPLDEVPPAPKPAVAALARMAALLEGTRAVCAGVALVGIDADALGRASAPLRAVRFERPDGTRRVTAIWTEEPAAETRAVGLVPAEGATEARLVLPDGEDRLIDPAVAAYVVYPVTDPLYVEETIATAP